MKKLFPYIIGAGLVLLLTIVIALDTTTPLRRMDERITLKQQDKIPYGTRVARELLSSLFPFSATPYDTKYPGGWDSIDTGKPNQAVILIADYLDADEDEVKRLSEFVFKGNYVFIVARSASDALCNYFKISFRSEYHSSNDSLKVRLEQPAYTSPAYYTYPGKKYEGYFYNVDTSQNFILGRNWAGFPNFIQLKKGAGSFFIHAAPLAFSNYFILHKDNAQYYGKAVSVLPKNISAILWNEYYLDKPYNPGNDDEPNWLRVLFSYPSFKWGVVVGAITLLLFVLLSMRRRQRMIPPYQKPKNDSLDFVKTLGRLYYDKKDHKNLATKMTAYFLEHVRSKYKLPTHTLDEGFIQSLYFKSGYAAEELKRLVASIDDIKAKSAVSSSELSHFHKQLELFYQNTQNGRTGV
ncbi:MAG TPA: DUF4350 domain-containing protein [Flavisolibacter sp.]|nr:DUF4350 domain-containing protein [Flavisolibacter sp.]